MPDILAVPGPLWKQIVNIADVAGEPPEDIALSILREGAETRLTAIADAVDAEVFRLEAELTAARARQAGLNGPSKAPQSPVEPPLASERVTTSLTLREAVRGVLGGNRNRTWTTAEVIEQMEAMGYEAPSYPQVNSALRVLYRAKEARNPARGQYAYRRRPSNHAS
jgi:hypothetical protein